MKDITQALEAELQELSKARDVLPYSYSKCVRVPIDSSLDHEQLESFQALTSRFATKSLTNTKQRPFMTSLRGSWL